MSMPRDLARPSIIWVSLASITMSQKVNAIVRSNSNIALHLIIPPWLFSYQAFFLNTEKDFVSRPHTHYQCLHFKSCLFTRVQQLIFGHPSDVWCIELTTCVLPIASLMRNLIKPKWFTGGNLMFLYRFVCRRVLRPWRRRRRRRLLFTRYVLSNFSDFFHFGRVDDPDLYKTWLDFGRFSSWPWLWIFNVKYGICYISAKMIRLPRNEIEIYQCNTRLQM